MASVNPADRKTALSKNLSQMTFMKRAKQKEEIEEKEAVEQRAVDDEHWVLDIPELAKKESQFISEPSYVVCMSLLFGRGSFRGFNPEIECTPIRSASGAKDPKRREKLYKEKNKELAETNSEDAEDEEFDETVDDIEMADRFSSLVGTLAKKMTKKRDRAKLEAGASTEEKAPRKRPRKFLKPRDD